MSLVATVVYVLFMIAFDAIDSSRLLAEVDSHLTDRLAAATHQGSDLLEPGGVDRDHDVDAAPVLLWRADAAGSSVALTDTTPALPAVSWSKTGQATTARLGTTTFRLKAEPVGQGWLVAGQSLAEEAHVQRVLLAAELIAGPFLLGALFLGTFVIGLKAAGPVEAARRRQLEFTADASHELRTPLSVIEAEVALSLSARRDAHEYREALERVRGESRRLRHIVEDMLWLARFDSEPTPPAPELVDLASVADTCVERFDAIAKARGLTLSVRRAGGDTWISAPGEWIERLAGVLADNACRYAGEAGHVVIVVGADAGRVMLAVDDSGPGIPAEDRPRLFDRFYRATAEGTGAGLGLAIADSIVRSTGGRWTVSDSPLGGAHMAVSWHRAAPAATPRSPRELDAPARHDEPSPVG
ncbi:MAG TPA: HAMP domain-containing sensor histidine kinase [Acidimicrobiales bacterium]|nr:HAMP domain-containing sensor histidine kinase [Acidimicrobiales bacterium]